MFYPPLKMNAKRALGVGLIWLALIGNGKGQGFVNLDFEQATVAPTPAGQFGSLFADPALGFPGWTMGSNGSGPYRNYTLYNNLTLGSVAQVLVGPTFPNALGMTPLQGSYSALLQFGPDPNLTTGARR